MSKIEKPSLLVQLFSLLLPVVLTILIVKGISWQYGKKASVEIVTLAVTSFSLLGKFIVFAPVVPLEGLAAKLQITYSSYQLAIMVIYMDVMVALIIAYNFHLLKKLYWIGPHLMEIQQDCSYLLRSNKWMKKFATVGVVGFVSFPIAGTGAIGAAFMAHLLGFSRLGTVFITFIGSIFGSFAMAYGAVYFKAQLKNFLEHPTFFYTGIAVVVLLVILAGWKLKSMVAEQRALVNKDS